MLFTKRIMMETSVTFRTVGLQTPLTPDFNDAPLEKLKKVARLVLNGF